jgi:hypothetical protein
MLLTSFSIGLAAVAAWAGPDMRSGRPEGQPPPLPEGTVPVATSVDTSRFAPPNDEPVTPLAVTLFEWGVPFSRGWDVYGIRVNTCLPGWTAGHNDIYGLDFGVSGELTGDAAGVSCNFFDNICRDFGGIQIGGVYNRVKGDAPFALQATLGHNRANAMNGLQAGVWNVAAGFRGLQIGLINHAEKGAGLQIGLWNACGTHASPILGAVF